MAGIHTAICSVMAECPAISKAQVNRQQGFKYRGVDMVMNVLQPLFVRHKVFCVPEVLESAREERATKNGGNLIYTVLRMKYTFYAEDGSSISAVVQGEGMDSADKSSNKAMAVAYKYACFQILSIPTEETAADPDADTPEPSTPTQPQEDYRCEVCGKEFLPFEFRGRQYTARDAYEGAKARTGGKALCKACRDVTDDKPD